MGIKLNIGAGKTVIDGYTPIDIKDGLDALSLPQQNASVEAIRASHILEHFSFADSHKALAEWYRVLEPSGWIWIAVPDITKIDFNTQLGPFKAFGGQTDEHDFHKSGWTERSLTEAMQAAGFESVRLWSDDHKDTASDPCSLRLCARKGPEAVGSSESVKICALMSCPRLGFNDFWGGAMNALRPWGIPIRRFTGAFWGQCLQNGLEELIEEGIDWALTLDYDTLFTSEDFDKLIGHFGQNPEIDAIAALQPKRSEGTPLMTRKGARDVEVTGAPIKVDSAHFGLTLIRLERLKDIPKPWFVGRPGPDGTWTSDERLDPDIWFWHQWRENGRSLYVAPDVRVGHLEMLVSQFNEDMQQEHISVKEWFGGQLK